MIFAGTVPITPFSISPFIDRALSGEALVLRELIREVSEFPGSVAVGEPKREAQIALVAAYNSALMDGWDGPGSVKAEPSTYIYADQFIRLLPSSVPIPEITVDSDGEIFFEWDRGRRLVFSVSVGRDGTLTFAGLFGNYKIHGTESLGEVLPPHISTCLKRLHAAIGVGPSAQ